MADNKKWKNNAPSELRSASPLTAHTKPCFVNTVYFSQTAAVCKIDPENAQRNNKKFSGPKKF